MFKAFIPLILLTLYLTILLWTSGLGKKSFKQPKMVACGNKKVETFIKLPENNEIIIINLVKTTG